MSQQYLKVENGQHKKDNASARKEDRHVHDAVVRVDHHGQRDERGESVAAKKTKSTRTSGKMSSKQN